MLRFSKAAVPDGKVPSTGIWLTRISSPRPAIILAVTSRTNSGACAGTIGGRSNALVAVGRHGHLEQMRQRVVDGLEILAHHVGALAAVGLLDRLLDASDRLVARQHAGDGEEAGLQTVLMRPPRPTSRATLEASITKKRSFFSRICCLHRARQLVPHRVRAHRGC